MFFALLPHISFQKCVIFASCEIWTFYLVPEPGCDQIKFFCSDPNPFGRALGGDFTI